MYSVTQEDFDWPRLVPLREKASQPPLRTGQRIFCHDPVGQSRFCEQENYQDYIKHEKTATKDDDVLMSREKFMLLNENSGNKRCLEENREIKSVYQRDFASNDVTYDCLMKHARESEKQRESNRMCTKLSVYVDPFSFKKRIDKEPLFC